MNEDYNIIINQLKSNIEKIISLYRKEKELNNSLQKKVIVLEEELVKIKEINIEKEKKYQSLKIAGVLVKNSESEHEAKIKLNRIIREIDNCIALINK